jgi:hypothetical protein
MININKQTYIKNLDKKADIIFEYNKSIHELIRSKE